MTIETSIAPCPRCGGARTNIADVRKTPVLECGQCGALESELVGVIEPEPEEELLPPPMDDIEEIFGPNTGDGTVDELLPPPMDEEPSTAIATVPVTLQTPIGAARIDVLPVGTELPADVKFVPNIALRQAADDDAERLRSMGAENAEQMARLDERLAIQREHRKTIEAHFEEPIAAAYARHKRLTGLRNEFLAGSLNAIETGERRLTACKQKLEREEQERRRKAQEDADRQERERIAAEAQAAAAANAPPEVVEELQQQAQTATAPPVAQTWKPQQTATNSSFVKKWRARLKGTPSDSLTPLPADGNLSTLNPAQNGAVLELMKAVIDGKAPICVFRLDTSYLDKRAAADKGALKLPGIEAFEDEGVRGKSSRAR